MKPDSFVEAILMNVAFLGGLWRGVGVNPEAAVIEGIAGVVYRHTGEPIIDIVGIYSTAALLTFLGAILIAYAVGRGLGLVAFLLAYSSGYFLVDAPKLATFGLVSAYCLGYAAPILEGEFGSVLGHSSGRR